MKQLQMKAVLALALIAPASVLAAKPAPIMESAKVLNQDIHAQRAGAMAMPMGTGVVAMPLYARSNTVEVETQGYRYTWVEIGRKNIILPVGGMIEFYRDKNFFIVRDSAGKLHKFGLLGQVVRE